MDRKMSIRLIIALALLTLSCQAFDDLGLTVSRTAEEVQPDAWPHSTITRLTLLDVENAPILPFDVENLSDGVTVDLAGPGDLPPGLLLPQETVPVPRGQAVQIDTIHLTPALLRTISIFINGQPVSGEETAEGEPFPEGYVNLLVRSEDRLVKTGVFRPQWPTREQELSLVWVGLVPGTYELSLSATDITDPAQPGNVIVQRIEVQEPAQ